MVYSPCPNQGSTMLYSPCPQPWFSHDPQSLPAATVLPSSTVPARSHRSPIIHSPCPQPGFSHGLQSLPQPEFYHVVQSLSPTMVLPRSTVPARSHRSPTQTAHDTHWTQDRVASDYLDVLEQTNISGLQESKERPAGLPLSYRPTVIAQFPVVTLIAVHNAPPSLPSAHCCQSVAYLTIRHLLSNYEGWNFNSGNYLFTTDTKQIHVSKFYSPSM